MALAAILGGVARYLHEFSQGQRSFVWVLFAIHCLTSAFTGWVIGSAVLLIDRDWAIVAASISGWLGVQALEFMTSLLKRKLGS